MAAAVLGALSFTSYARLIEPNWLEVSRREVLLSGKSRQRPIKLLHMADFHAPLRGGLEFIEEAVNVGAKLRPDLICLTGDFFTRKCDQIDEFARVLSRLSSAAPTFACLGNHDGGVWAGKPMRGGYPDIRESQRLLEQSGIYLLHNKSEQRSVEQRAVALIGVGDPWAKEFRPEEAFHAAPAPDCIRIVLSHNPDTKERLQRFAWDLMLCGHTHGGQLSLPLFGAPFAPVHDKRFVAGLCPWEGRFLHITRGVGSGFKMRFNCRPEISLLEVV